MIKKNKSKLVRLVQGRQIPWGIPDVEYPWVGGNYYQLDEWLRQGNWGFLEEIKLDGLILSGGDNIGDDLERDTTEKKNYIFCFNKKNSSTGSL